MASFGYTYDANKNKLTETLGAPMANYGFDSTVYDNEDRLTAWSRVDDNKDQEWELSAVGDWESFTEEANEVERTHNDVHELTAVGQTSLTYDAKGNLTKDGAQTYAKYIWDFDNRLQAVDTDDDNTSEVFYTYDALGRRITKSIVVLSGYDQGSSSSGISRRSAGGRSITRRGASTTVTTTTVFVPDGQQEVAEYTYVSTVGTPNLTKKYVYASYIDEPVLMLNVSGETETKYYYHQNSLYSVAALTNQSGTVVERYSYLAYGNITFHDSDGSVAASQESTVGNPYLFTGRRFDPETSLQYSRARYYHFNLGRWISRDPIGYRGGYNQYSYVANKPINYVDPFGTLIFQLVGPGIQTANENGSLKAWCGFGAYLDKDEFSSLKESKIAWLIYERHESYKTFDCKGNLVRSNTLTAWLLNYFELDKDYDLALDGTDGWDMEGGGVMESYMEAFSIDPLEGLDDTVLGPCSKGELDVTFTFKLFFFEPDLVEEQFTLRNEYGVYKNLPETCDSISPYEWLHKGYTLEYPAGFRQETNNISTVALHVEWNLCDKNNPWIHVSGTPMGSGEQRKGRESPEGMTFWNAQDGKWVPTNPK